MFTNNYEAWQFSEPTESPEKLQRFVHRKQAVRCWCFRICTDAWRRQALLVLRKLKFPDEYMGMQCCHGELWFCRWQWKRNITENFWNFIEVYGTIIHNEMNITDKIQKQARKKQVWLGTAWGRLTLKCNLKNKKQKTCIGLYYATYPAYLSEDTTSNQICHWIK